MENNQPMKKERMSGCHAAVLLFIVAFMVGFFSSYAIGNQNVPDHHNGGATGVNTPSNYLHVTTGDSVRSVVEHPAFKGFGEYLLPWDNRPQQLDVILSNVGSLLPYHSHVNPDIVVRALNHMIDEVVSGREIFYEFYNERQKRQDPAKHSAGLFFFRGEPGAPFAVICPGGGFSYVGSLHEGFPHAVEISKKGLNAFVLKYRAESGLKASEDLAAAISFIVDHADTLGVSKEGYSLWGSSAGARMVGDIALNGTAYYGGRDLPKPGAVIIAYTGHSIYSPGFPPTFITVSADDPIASASVVDRRVHNLKGSGVTVKYHRFKHAGHGFGTGVGTDAAGWVNDAIRFWINNSN
jgi:acetyl esterase/lipase